MTVTEVRIKLVPPWENERLLAYVTVTFDAELALHDLKIIDKVSGPFLAMPNRKLTDRCGCGGKNHLLARYCNSCGTRLNEHRAIRTADGRAGLYADLAHPINADVRRRVESAVMLAYREELEASRQPGYVCRYGEDHEGHLR